MNETMSIGVGSFRHEGPTVRARVVRFPEEVIQKVWDKATGVIGYDPKVWRKDACGAWICRHDYGNRTSLYGWEIDHLRAPSDGGTNHPSNLRALHWENYVAKQEQGRLVCCVTAPNGHNVRVLVGETVEYLAHA